MNLARVLSPARHRRPRPRVVRRGPPVRLASALLRRRRRLLVWLDSPASFEDLGRSGAGFCSGSRWGWPAPPWRGSPWRRPTRGDSPRGTGRRRRSSRTRPGPTTRSTGSRVLVHRPVRLPGQAQMRDVVYTVWLASGAFGLPVFAALILATPGWRRATRARALAWGLALLTVTQIASMLVAVDFWQQMPVTLLQAPAFYLPATRPGGCRSSPPSTTSSRSWGGASSSWWCTSPCSAFGRRRAPPDGARAEREVSVRQRSQVQALLWCRVT